MKSWKALHLPFWKNLSSGSFSSLLLFSVFVTDCKATIASSLWLILPSKSLSFKSQLSSHSTTRTRSVVICSSARQAVICKFVNFCHSTRRADRCKVVRMICEGDKSWLLFSVFWFMSSKVLVHSDIADEH